MTPSPRRSAPASGTRARSASADRASSSSAPSTTNSSTRFAAATKKLRIGDPLDDATDVGALISEAHLQKVMGYIDLATKEGGTIVAGGHRVDRPGYFVEPTIITGLGCDCRVLQEEIFGPVVTDHAVRRRRRSDRLRQLHPLRPLRHRLDARPLPRAPRRRGARRRHDLDQLLAPARPPRPLRRHEGERSGKRRRLRVAELLHRGEECLREDLEPIRG